LNLSAYEGTKHALLLSRLVRDLRNYFNDQFEVLRQERKDLVDKCCHIVAFQIEQNVDVEDVIQVF
jgi:hypothetical protein